MANTFKITPKTFADLNFKVNINVESLREISEEEIEARENFVNELKKFMETPSHSIPK